MENCLLLPKKHQYFIDVCHILCHVHREKLMSNLCLYIFLENSFCEMMKVLPDHKKVCVDSNCNLIL